MTTLLTVVLVLHGTEGLLIRPPYRYFPFGQERLFLCTGKDTAGGVWSPGKGSACKRCSRACACRHAQGGRGTSESKHAVQRCFLKYMDCLRGGNSKHPSCEKIPCARDTSCCGCHLLWESAWQYFLTREFPGLCLFLF